MNQRLSQILTDVVRTVMFSCIL